MNQQVVLIGLLFLCVTSIALSNEVPKNDLKRTKSTKERTIIADATEERSQVYQEHYNAKNYPQEDKDHYKNEQLPEEESLQYSDAQRDPLANANQYAEHSQISHSKLYGEHPRVPDRPQYEEPQRIPGRINYEESLSDQNHYEEPSRHPTPDKTHYEGPHSDQKRYEEPPRIPNRMQYEEPLSDTKQYVEQAADRTQYVEAVRIPQSKRKPYEVSKSDDYHDDDLKEPQAYKFGYEIKDHHQGHQYRHEQKDEKGNIQGRFGYRDPKGQYRQVNYVADDNGFRAKIQTNEAGIVDENPADVKIQKDQEVTADGHQEGDSSGKQQTYDHVGSAPKEYSRKAMMEEDEDYADDERVPPHKDYMHHGSHIYHPFPSEKYDDSEPQKDRSEKDRPSSFAYRHYYKNKSPHGKRYTPHEDESDEDVMGQYHRGKYYRREPKDKKFSTYQYELDSMKHEDEPDHERDYEPTQDGGPYQSKNNAHKPVVILENGPPSKEEPGMHHLAYYDAYRNPNYENEHPYKSRERVVILPQTNEHNNGERYHTIEHHGNYDGHGRPLEEKEYKRPVKEYRIKFEKPMDPTQKVIPAIHQYIQIINEQDQPKAQHQKENNHAYGYKRVESDAAIEKNRAPSYKYEPIPPYPTPVDNDMVYRYEPVPPSVQSQTNTAISNQYKYAPDQQPVSQSDSGDHGHPQMQLLYSDKPGGNNYRSHITPSNFERKTMPYSDEKTPSYASSLSHASHNKDQQDHPSAQQAVLEIDADVYKNLFEKKTPGQKLVAIPVNAVHGDHAKNAADQTHPSPKPHGILHIPLDSVHQGNDLSKIFRKFNPQSHHSHVILHPANTHNNDPESSRSKPMEPLSVSKDHATYNGDSYTPSASSRGRYVKDKDYADKKWIPLTPRSKQSLRQNAYGTEDHSSLNVSPSNSNTKVLKFSSKENVDKVDLLRKPKGVAADFPSMRPTRYVLVSPIHSTASEKLKKL
nr:uncharacterized protein LOC107448105 [Parasteatoda tepidariorum]